MMNMMKYLTVSSGVFSHWVEDQKRKCETKSGVPAETRTQNLRLRRPSLYPLELRGPSFKLYRFQSLKSTGLLHRMLFAD